MKKKLNILIIVSAYPPNFATGALRWWRFSKFLVERGHTVRVIVAGESEEEVIDGVRVRRMPESKTLRKWWMARRLQTAAKTPSGNLTKAEGERALKITFKKSLACLRTLARKGQWFWDFPAHNWNWGKAVGELGIKWCEEERPDVVVGSYPSLGALRGARIIAEQYNVPWIADYRDPCSNSYDHPIRIGGWWYNRLKNLEKGMNDSAELVMSTNKRMADYMAGSEGKQLLISNCYEGLANQHVEFSIKSDFSEIHLIYAGSVAPYHRLMPLFEAIRRVGEKRTGAKIIFNYYGSAGDIVKLKAERVGLPLEHLKLHGLVEREVAIERQRAADLLIVSCLDSRSADCVVTGKIMDYLMTDRPVIGISSEEGDAMTEMFASTGIGFSCSHADGLTEFLTRLSEQPERMMKSLSEQRKIDGIRAYSLKECGVSLEDAMLGLV